MDVVQGSPMVPVMLGFKRKISGSNFENFRESSCFIIRLEATDLLGDIPDLEGVSN